MAATKDRSTPRETPETMRAICDGDGIFFRVWPDGEAREIEDEDDLRDVYYLLSVAPNPGDAARIVWPGATLIDWWPCDECDGTGVVTVRPWQPRQRRESTCRNCLGNGYDYRWDGRPAMAEEFRVQVTAVES